jgi:hypothetical protein
MATRQVTKDKVEAARGEIFHMILFAMAWVMIGEYAINFRDYVAAAIIVLVAVVILAFHSISLYNLEDSLQDHVSMTATRQRTVSSVASRYALIFILEGVAIMATWIALIRTGHEKWLVPGFALIAGLHFLPLAAVIRVKSYYWLGAGITIFAILGFWLVASGRIAQNAGDALIAYACAAGAVIDGGWIAARIKARTR